ncbi:MAG: UMP kinase [Candidatus Cloacimonadales bacterium]|jgi:uridylate kinase|nr:UMP kinase [Candidatus Cloacimonadota bacterium]MDD3501533.1 UMP kinase [Candidatus Cloacimonadota bacterium]MDX9977039.1 UMP kinase [Candidatus Cloacimonadales bacterium]
MSVFKPEKIHRVILKLSGEYLAGKEGFGIDNQALESICNEIIEVRKLGYSIGIVIGGGNYYRGSEHPELNRAAADNVGMLATLQNAVIVSNALQAKNYAVEVFTAFECPKVAKLYTYQCANDDMKKGKICFFAGGTGNPFFTTDTAAVLRAIELECDIVLKGTKVDGVFTADPHKDKNAQFIPDLTYQEAIRKQLNVMDMTAFSLARDYNVPIKVFNIGTPNSIRECLTNNEFGTYVHS